MKKTGKARGNNVIAQRVRQEGLRSLPPTSQENLADRLAAQGVNLNRSAISLIESQDRHVLDYEAVALAAALKVSVARLFGEKG